MQTVKLKERYHQVLGVSPNATPDEVKAAYRALAKRFHPDRLRNPDIARRAEEKLKEINAAWSEYCDSLKRPRAGRQSHKPEQPAWKAGPFHWHPPGATSGGDEPEPHSPARSGATQRDRLRAERRAAIREREARERRMAGQARRVRQERQQEITERHTREHERIRAALQTALAGVATLIGACLVLLVVAFYVYTHQ